MTLGAVAYTHRSFLEEIAAGFAPADPELITERALLRRTDSKFLVDRATLASVLERVTADYAVIGGLPASYRTLYFDTGDLEMFRDHRQGRRPRQKVRIRHYDDRQLSFTEIKTKLSESLTVKHRREIAFGEDRLDRDLIGAHGHIDPARLGPAIWTNFERLTLVGSTTPERVTIDLDLHFVRGDRRIDAPDRAILEVKQAPFSATTPIWRALRSLGLQPCSASKYITGIALAYDQV